MARPSWFPLGLLHHPATGAVVGQVTQAVAGLVLSVAAARWLGASGLATFSVVYGLTVLATAVVSGLVGDSLTVLDRGDRGIRAALEVWALGVAGVAGAAGAVLAWSTGLVPGAVAVVLGAAVTAFVLEDALRRLLMATGRFWALAPVDGTSLVLAAATLATCALSGPLTLASFFLALLVGQTGAAVVAWRRLSPAERPRGPWRSPDLRAVWAFGAWRAAGQSIHPGLQTGLRVLVVGAAGAAAYGPLEAARIYTAPTLVLVTGLGSYLLPRYVAMLDRPAAAQLRAADRTMAGLAGIVAVAGLLAVALQPVAAPVLTGGAYPVPVPAVAGWAAYAVAYAVLLPYSGLAVAHRRQRRVLVYRLLEFAGLAAVGVLVSSGGVVVWGPLVLAAGPLLVAVAIRWWVLVPLVRDEEPAAGRRCEIGQDLQQLGQPGWVPGIVGQPVAG
jgi:O-antigen/teichoic acid export membrane protein